MGDGDCSAIGGNHFIHAARRNVDLTALVFNNSIYGMTGGQMSPTTHIGDKSTTSVYGNVEPAFDLCELAHAAGATYVARGTSWGYQQLVNVIAGGIAHRGFSMVEAMAICPIYYGRFNLTADPAGVPAQPEGARGAGRHSSTRARRAATTSTRSGCCTTASARSTSPRSRGLRERAQEAGRWLSRRRDRRASRSAARGSGGQGILLAAAIIAEAAAALGRHVVQTQSYGPEARGGASKAEVIVADEAIDYPEVRRPDVSLVLSQAAYDKYAGDTRPGGLLIYDSGLVEVDPDDRSLVRCGLPFTQVATDELGKKVVTNIVAVGALAQLSGVLPGGRGARRGAQPRAAALPGAQRAGVRPRAAAGRGGAGDAGHALRPRPRRLAAWTCSNTKARGSSPTPACRCCRRSWRRRRRRLAARPSGSARTCASRRRPRPAAAARPAASASAAPPARSRPRPRTSWP